MSKDPADAPSNERADTIGEVYGSGKLLEFSELLMDLEEDRYARTVVMGILAEMEAEPRKPSCLGPRLR